MTDAPQSSLTLRVGTAGLALSVLVASLGTSAANVALPTIATELGGTFAQTQWVALAYLLAMTATSLTVGHLGDLLGRRRVLLAGIITFSIAAVLCAVAPTLGALIAARALQGIGAAVMMALPLARARDTVPAERLGAIMGSLGTTAAVGTASGPALGGLLIGVTGWPGIFAVMAPLGILTAVLVGRSEESTPPSSRARGRFDVGGVLLLTVAVALYTLGATGQGVSVAWSAPALFTGAGITATLFVWRESRAAHPILPPALLKIRAVSLGAVLNLIVGAVMMSTLVVGPFFLAGALRLSPVAIGVTMAAGPVASILTGVLAGRLVDRFGSRGMTTVGLATMLAGSLTLALLPAAWGLVGYMAGTVLLAPGYQLFLAANNTSVLSGTPTERRGVTSGLLGLSRNLGLVTGASVLAALFASAAGAVEIADASAAELTNALSTTFLTTAGMLILGVALSFAASSSTRAARIR